MQRTALGAAVDAERWASVRFGSFPDLGFGYFRPALDFPVCPRSSAAAAGPEPRGRDARACGERFQLRPRNLRVADAGPEAAVGASHHVLAPDEVCVANEALGHQLGMLDEV